MKSEYENLTGEYENKVATVTKLGHNQWIESNIEFIWIIEKQVLVTP